MTNHEPLPRGTVCNDTGLCDGQGTCVPQPPALQTVNIAIDENLESNIRTLLRGSEVSLDATGMGPVLVTGSHTECVDGPGPGPLICYEVTESTNAFVRFSETLKSFYYGQTGQTLSDLAFPMIGAECGGPVFLTFRAGLITPN